MNVAETRTALESVLDVVDLLVSGEKMSKEELQSIEALSAEIRAGLVPSKEAPKGGHPRGHWVFAVHRTQFTEISVDAPDLYRAANLAAAELHSNIDAYRFTWDHSDPLTLTVIDLKRSPEPK